MIIAKPGYTEPFSMIGVKEGETDTSHLAAAGLPVIVLAAVEWASNGLAES
jgi:hypothetical protein